MLCRIESTVRCRERVRPKKHKATAVGAAEVQTITESNRVRHVQHLQVIIRATDVTHLLGKDSDRAENFSYCRALCCEFVSARLGQSGSLNIQLSLGR